MGTEPHPSVERLPKDLLNSQLPLDMPLGTTLPSRGARTQLHSLVGRHKLQNNLGTHPASRKPALASGPTSPTRGQTPDARKPQSHSLQIQYAHGRLDLTLGPAGSRPCPLAGECASGMHRTSPREGYFSKVKKCN